MVHVVFAAAGLAAPYTINPIITPAGADVTAPVVTVVGANPQTIVVGGAFSDSGATWTDNIDGSGVIALGNTGSLDVNQTGSYSVTYTYVDVAGNTGSAVRTVDVVALPPADTNAPTLSIN